MPAPLPSLETAAAAVAAAVAPGIGRYVWAIIGAGAIIVTSLGALAIHDWRSSVQEAATAVCHDQDLLAAEAARDALQKRYDVVSTNMQLQANQLRADADRRRAELQAQVDAERARASKVKSCTVSLRGLKAIDK